MNTPRCIWRCMTVCRDSQAVAGRGRCIKEYTDKYSQYTCDFIQRFIQRFHTALHHNKGGAQAIQLANTKATECSCRVQLQCRVKRCGKWLVNEHQSPKRCSPCMLLYFAAVQRRDQRAARYMHPGTLVPKSMKGQDHLFGARRKLKRIAAETSLGIWYSAKCTKAIGRGIPSVQAWYHPRIHRPHYESSADGAAGERVAHTDTLQSIAR